MTLFTKTLSTSLIIGVGVFLSCCLQSCSEPSVEKVIANTDECLHNLNIGGAQAIIYKDDLSRASGANGYYKLTQTGLEEKLRIRNKNSKRQDIQLLWVLNVSDRYMFVHPDPWDVGDAVGLDEYGQGYAVWSAINLICIVDKFTGRIYKTSYLPIGPFYNETSLFGTTDYSNEQFTKEQGDFVYIKGDETNSYGYYSQIYRFDPLNLSIAEMLPEGQKFKFFDVDNDGFIGYLDDQAMVYKIKSPGGSIIVMPLHTFMCNYHFYSIIDESVYKWTSDDGNTLVKSKVCDVPEDLRLSLYQLIEKSSALFENYIFDGKNFLKLNEDIPYEFFYRLSDNHKLYETRDAWYVIDSHNNLLKLDKTTFETSSIPLTEYQILEIVSNGNGANLSFIGIRYSDSAKVFGKILSDNSFVVEYTSQSGQNIYNLIPLD